MDITLVKAAASDAEAMLEMQKECFKPHFEKYQDVETSPVNESIEKMLFRIIGKHGYHTRRPGTKECYLEQQYSNTD